MDNFIGTRLKAYRERTKTKMPRIATETGISKENLYKWEKGVKPSDIDDYNKLKNYLDKMESQAADGKSAYQNTEEPPIRTSLISIFLTQDEDTQEYPDEKAVPGSVIHIKGRPALIAWRNESSVIGEVDGLINVAGESMEPRFKSGSWIAIKKLKYTRIINAGYYYYIIDKNGKGLLRKVSISGASNSLTLLSENQEEYPSITRSFEDILAIFSVEAVVTKQSV
jgi:phage repressor protein C with HTH and peptisase S24 domain